MVESDESFIEVTGHVGMYFPIGVVPLNGESNVFVASLSTVIG